MPISLTDRDKALVSQVGQVIDRVALIVIFKAQEGSVAGEEARLFSKRDNNVEQLLPIGTHAVAGRVGGKVNMRAGQQKQFLLVLLEALEPLDCFRWAAVQILVGVAPQVVEIVASIFSSIVVPVEHEGKAVQYITPDFARYTSKFVIN